MFPQTRIVAFAITPQPSVLQHLITPASIVIAHGQGVMVMARPVRITATWIPMQIALSAIPPQPSLAARGSTIPVLPIIVCHVTALVTAQHHNPIRATLTLEAMCSATPAIQQTAGEIRAHSIIAPIPTLTTTGAAIILATTELAKQRVLTVIKTMLRRLFHIPIGINTSLSAQVVTRVISRAKEIITVERTVRSNKTKIALNRDAIVLTQMDFD